MFTSFFDRLAVTLLERQVHDSAYVELIATWDRYVPSRPGEDGSHLLGAYWDPVWFVPSRPGRVRFVDTVNVCQYADLMCGVYRRPSSIHFGDDRVRRSAETAIDFCAQRVVAGRPITNRCFDFGLLALTECVETLGDDLNAVVMDRAKEAMALAADDLLGLYDTADEPFGSHNHQGITGHTILLCGMVLDDGPLVRRGRDILHENLGYLDDEGVGHEHDRKYDMTVAGTLARAHALTGEAAYLEAARRAARHALPFVTPGGELVELTSHRPDCCGDDMVAYALYAFAYLAKTSHEDDRATAEPFRDAARRMTHLLHMRQRPDGLLPGFLYAQDNDYRCEKMDPYYMTGYGLPPLMWTDRLEKGEHGVGPAIGPPCMDSDLTVQTRAERTFIHRRGAFQVMASGYDRQCPPRQPHGMLDGPVDALVIDHCGPGVWGLCFQIRIGERWYGDVGGFTPRLRLAPDHWNCGRHDGGWHVLQRLDALDDDGRCVASLDCELEIHDDRAILSLKGEHDGAREWIIGPNVRTALGSLVYNHEHGSDYCHSLNDDHPFSGPIDLLANGRRLRASVTAEGTSQAFLTPLFGKNDDLQERLVPGQVWGLRTSVPGARLSQRWQFEAG